MNKSFKLNRNALLLLITILSVSLSYLITSTILYFYPNVDERMYTIIILVATVNPLIIAPLVTYKLVSLYYKVEDLNKELEFLNKHDDLTKIYNKKYLIQLANTSLEELEKKDSSFALFLIDYDYFKKVNDTYGHTIGDNVLIEFSKTISSNIRKTDYFGRYGGEEFLLICPNTNKEEAAKLAEKLRVCVNKKFDINEIEITMSISIGVTILKTKDNKTSLSSLINQADKALYRAKNSGRNKVEFFKC